MSQLLGKPRSLAHRCANCTMWSANPGGLTGICEVGDLQPLQGFDGNGVDADQGFRTTPETYCDFQVPIPPPGPPCPKCGAPLHQGYGLAGGGMGAYELCEVEGCGHFEKWQDAEMEE